MVSIFHLMFQLARNFREISFCPQSVQMLFKGSPTENLIQKLFPGKITGEVFSNRLIHSSGDTISLI